MHTPLDVEIASEMRINYKISWRIVTLPAFEGVRGLSDFNTLRGLSSYCSPPTH